MCPVCSLCDLSPAVRITNLLWQHYPHTYVSKPAAYQSLLACHSPYVQEPSAISALCLEPSSPAGSLGQRRRVKEHMANFLFLSCQNALAAQRNFPVSCCSMTETPPHPLARPLLLLSPSPSRCMHGR